MIHNDVRSFKGICPFKQIKISLLIALIANSYLAG